MKYSAKQFMRVPSPAVLMLLAVVTAAVITSAWLYHAAAPGANGIWHGTFDINGRGNFNFTALYVDGRAIALSPDARVAYRGTVAIEGGDYRSDMDMFFINGSPFDKVSLSGTRNSAQMITAQFVTEKAGDQGTLVLKYDGESYEKISSLAQIAGEWILYEGITITKILIRPDGRITGADTNGCGYDGIAGIIDPARNAYRFDMLVSSCNRVDGEFTGMGFLMTSIEEDDTLHLQVSNDDWGLYMPIVRDSKKMRGT